MAGYTFALKDLYNLILIGNNGSQIRRAMATLWTLNSNPTMDLGSIMPFGWAWTKTLEFMTRK